MHYKFEHKAKTIFQQADAIRHQYPGFSVTHNPSVLRAQGYWRPTARSEPYQIEVRYTLQQKPVIAVLKPTLVKNLKGEDIPHLYGDGTLCLYMPLYGEFNYSDLIATTIIPWSGLWLYHYENWHMTGEWEGGGIH